MEIYVSTFAKYNNGTLKGAWLDIENYSDAEKFFAACKELHSDESDPEFMFQDFDDVPARFRSETMNEADLQELYDFINEYNEDDRQIIEEYWEEEDASAEPKRIMEYYCFTGSGIEYAEELSEELGELENVPNFIRYHIDWEGVWRDMSYDGYTETSNYIFDTNR